ncbi:hypothetical protein ACFY2R_17985 [Micromonospora olivasterospora]|uniref:Uncharacterized protein n=1 Tax=Micromonospora olivasterospora TaxID=1880 RepID=A0A562HUA4_MICOL|nr:hypothetical protein [Micromonospora olivasterospora]TWH62321.1 hypothetical protein JD77_06372 [Micromonospora olivasterospora]
MTPTTTAAQASALTAAASLLATAALMDAVGTQRVSVTVADVDIDIQVPARTGTEAARAAVVAAYAHALSTPVHRRAGGPHTWIEAHGTIAGHPVHVWTIADCEPATRQAVA